MKKKISLIVALLFSLSLLFGCGGATPSAQPGGDDHGHDHGDLPYEWSGELVLAEGTYTLEFAFSGDPSMDIAFAMMDGVIEDLEHHGHHIMESDKDEISQGSTFTAWPDYGYTLILNEGPTEFNFVIEEDGRYMIFMEHMPEEFDLVIFDEAGEELIPENQREFDEDGNYKEI